MDTLWIAYEFPMDAIWLPQFCRRTPRAESVKHTVVGALSGADWVQSAPDWVQSAPDWTQSAPD